MIAPVSSGARFALLLCAAFGIALVGCSDPIEAAAPSTKIDSLMPPTTIDSLIPLAVGTRWTYDRNDSIEVTTDSLLHSSHSTVITSVVADIIDVDGGKWAVLEDSNDVLGGSISGPNYLADLPGGVYELLPVPGVVLANLEFAYPTIKGTVFNFGIGTVLSTDSVITVPAGTFHCLVYAEDQDRVFVAPGIGVVMHSLTPTQLLSSGTLLLQEQVFYSLRAMAKP